MDWAVTWRALDLPRRAAEVGERVPRGVGAGRRHQQRRRRRCEHGHRSGGAAGCSRHRAHGSRRAAPAPTAHLGFPTGARGGGPRETAGECWGERVRARWASGRRRGRETRPPLVPLRAAPLAPGSGWVLDCYCLEGGETPCAFRCVALVGAGADDVSYLPTPRATRYSLCKCSVGPTRRTRRRWVPHIGEWRRARGGSGDGCT